MSSSDPPGEKRKSTVFISAEVKNKSWPRSVGAVDPDVRQRAQDHERAGALCQKQGTPPPGDFVTICLTLKTYVKIQQLNRRGRETTKKLMGQRMKMCLKKGKMSSILYHTVGRELTEIALDLNNTVAEKAEEQRICWTAYRNLKMWFDNWMVELDPLGFTYVDKDGEVQTREDKYDNLLNLDETCISLEGSQGNCGGCPPNK